MSRRTSRNNSYTSGISPSGFYIADVVAIDGDYVSVKVPRLGLNNIYENVPFTGFTPAVGDRIWVSFVEGKASHLLGFVGAGDTGTDITEIVAGTNLNGGGTGGSVTVNLDDDITLSTVTADGFYGDLYGAIHVLVKNVSGGSLTKGTPVYATGAVGASGAVEVEASLAGTASTMPAMGLLDQDLANNGQGDVVVSGVLQNIDTDTPGYSVGDELYVAASGGLTTTRPTGSSELVQKIGKVVRVQQNTGEILVQGAGRTNDVPNSFTTSGDVTVGGDLTVNGTTVTLNTETLTVEDNIILLNSNVSGTPSLDAGIEIERGSSSNVSFLWDETNDRWTIGSESLVAGTFIGALTGNVTGNLTGDVTGNADTATTATNLSGGTVAATTLTASGDANFDSGTLFVDVSANRVGVGTSSPSAELEVRGSSNPEIRIIASDGTDPALYFGDNTDSVRGGIVYDTSANDLQFRGYNNTTVMTIESDAQVGIGTNSPGAKLHVDGGTSDTNIRVTSTDSGAYIGFEDSATSGNWYAQRMGAQGDALVFQTGASTRMTVASNGRVGIGTPNPGFQLDVNGTINAQSYIRNSSGTNEQLSLRATGTGTRPYLAFYNYNGSSYVRRGYIGYPNAGSSTSTINLVSDSGNVQITGSGGEVNATPKLSINGGPELSDPSSANYLRITTAHGRIDLGPQNTTYCHIYTDRGSFYFNKSTLYANSTSAKIWHRGDLRGAAASVVVDSNGYGTINHGLGATPDFAFVGARQKLSNDNDNQLSFPVTSYNSTSITFRAYEVNGDGNSNYTVSTIISNATVYVFWMAGNQ